MGRPHEVVEIAETAETAAFPLSDRAGVVTGRSHLVDGGDTAH